MTRVRKQCSIEGCDNKAWARDWCNCHLTRWTKYGSPHIVQRTLPGECGKNTGYNRHLRNNEEPCPECAKAHLSKCGTHAGWKRHRASREPACKACDRAHTRHLKDRLARRRAQEAQLAEEAAVRNRAAKRLVAENLERFQELHDDERWKAGLT